jgi:long-chain acyl-CoA synthetase
MTGVPTAHNLADLVRAAAERGAQHPALIDVAAGSELSWARLDAAVSSEAERLRGCGVTPGDRVAVRLPTGAAFCVAVFGVLRAGCVAVPLPPGAPSPELRRVLADSGARVLVSEDHPSEVDITVIGPPALVVGPVEPAPAVSGGDELAVLAYTSGTSGNPRGVMLSHRALLANVGQCAALRPAPVTAADRVLLALPLFHVYGFGPGLLQVAAAGATAVLMERFDPEQALAVIERHRVTTIVGVPQIYQALLRLPAQRLRAGLATVRLLTSGAAPLEPALLQQVRTVTGLGVFEGYGLTETAPVLTSTLVSGQPKPGSVGRPLPGVQVRLVDTDGQPLSVVDMEEDASGTGLVAVRGANLFSGYWPDGQHGPDAEGWFRTGDVGYFDSDGDLHLVARVNDLIIVNGFNVYPHEVEKVLIEHPAVAQAAAVGLPDPETGETVKAVLVLREGAVLTAEDVLAHCVSQLARFKVPTVVEFVDALPRTPTGKLARARLRSAG